MHVADQLGPVREPIVIEDTVYHKHPTHWFPDGNVILLIEDTAVQIFRGIIDRRSTVLREMLPDSPQPLGMAGGPVVLHLEDKVDDFSFLLDAIMPQTCSIPRISSDRGWRSLIGLVQVARRYKVGDVAARAVKVLEDVLPTVQRPSQHTNVYRDPEAAVDVINFARHSGTPQFLPPAFYSLVIQEWTSCPYTFNPLTRLASEDQMRLLQGRAKMQAEVIDMGLSRWENCNGYQASKTCPHQDKGCWGGWGDGAWPKEDNATRWKTLLSNPLKELKTRAELPEHRYICKPCRDEFVAENNRMREELIGKLATFFGLGGDGGPVNGVE